jgi:mono/diheme cytochrome c family protein
MLLVLALTVAACGEESGGSGGSQTSAPSETPVTTPAPTTGGEGVVADGARLYEQHCTGCHGVDGRGSVTIAGEDDVAGVTAVIKNGAEGMPAYGDQLTAGQIETLADFVTTQLK